MGHSRWHVVRSGGPGEPVIRDIEHDDVPDAPPAEALATTLKELGYTRGGVCLAVAAHSVLSARINCNNLPPRRRRTPMLYRLEEHLPLEAEQLTADFLPTEGGQSLALAVETAPMQAVIDALGKAGIEVASICPTAMLALWHYQATGRWTGEYAVIVDGDAVHLFGMTPRGRPATWTTTAPRTGDVLAALGADVLAHRSDDSRPVVRLLGQWPDELAEAMRARGDFDTQAPDQTPALLAAAKTAAALATGRNAGWVDLRRDALAPTDAWASLTRPLAVAVLLTIVLLVAVAGMCLWRQGQCDTLTDGHKRLQRDQYARLYPGRGTPVNVKSALASEHRRLAGVHGTDIAAPNQTHAINTLTDLLAALPPALRLRIVEIRLSASGLLVEGQTREHTDAQLIAQAIGRVGFDVDPPRTEKLARGGVSFTITGKVRPEAAMAHGETRP